MNMSTVVKLVVWFIVLSPDMIFCVGVKPKAIGIPKHSHKVESRVSWILVKLS